MNFYYFGGNIEGNLLRDLHDSHFAGTLFTYDAMQGDFFTRIAKDIKMNETFKYMVAIRPYSISPQYLCMINQSINEIMPDRLQINLISGHIKPHEENVGGIMGDVTDSSSNIERSNYLIRYIEMLEDLRKNPKNQIPDYYVSTTNKHVFQKSVELNSKLIIPYRNYVHKCWILKSENDIIIEKGEPFSLENTHSMISISAIIRETQKEIDEMEKPYLTYDTDYFTYDQFEQFVKQIEAEGIKDLMITGWPYEEGQRVIKFVKRYVENNG